MITAHPGLPEFEYIKPKNLLEASQFLSQHTHDARPLSGGTDVFVRMRDGIWKEKYLVDVKSLDGMDTLEVDPQGGLTIGTGVNMNRVAAFPQVQACYPLLAEACRTVASYQLRNRATVVGNLCNASPAGDTIGACLVYGGVLDVFAADGPRTEPLSTFFMGPGKTRLKPGDVVTALRLPPPIEGAAGKYIKLGRNNLSDLAIVGVTVLAQPEAAAASGVGFRIALASVAPVPLVPKEAEDRLREGRLNREAFQEAARLAEAACQPIDDVRGSARYRKEMVRVLTYKALLNTWVRLERVS